MTKIITIITVIILIFLLYLFGWRANQNAVRNNKLSAELKSCTDRNVNLVNTNRDFEIKNERLSVRELSCQKGDEIWKEKYADQTQELNECKTSLETIDTFKNRNTVLSSANQQYEINNEKLAIQLKSCQSINIVEKVKASFKKNPIKTTTPSCDPEQLASLKIRNSLLIKDNSAYEIRAEKADSLQMRNEKLAQQNREYEIRLERHAATILRLKEVVIQLKKEKARREQYFSDDF